MVQHMVEYEQQLREEVLLNIDRLQVRRGGMGWRDGGHGVAQALPGCCVSLAGDSLSSETACRATGLECGACKPKSISPSVQAPLQDALPCPTLSQ